jgi:hypothetical protein
MHRRQYYPGSGRHGAPTLSRRQLAHVNRKLVEKLNATEQIAKAENEAKRKAQDEREELRRRSFRGFIERTKKFLGKPIRLSKRSA